MSDLQAEIAIWRAVLEHPSGVGLEFAGCLISARRNEDGSFEVAWEQPGDEGLLRNEYKAFEASDSEGAARFFVEKRRELEYGYEFEVEE